MCSNYTSCLVCRPGLFKNSIGNCDKCPPNCISCLDGSTCNICEKEFFKDSYSTKCVKKANNENTQEISFYETNKNLKVSDYSQDIVNSLEIENCKILENNRCIFCDFGFYWDGVSCTTCIENCIMCTNGKDCTLCYDGFTLLLQNKKFICNSIKVN